MHRYKPPAAGTQRTPRGVVLSHPSSHRPQQSTVASTTLHLGPKQHTPSPDTPLSTRLSRNISIKSLFGSIKKSSFDKSTGDGSKASKSSSYHIPEVGDDAHTSHQCGGHHHPPTHTHQHHHKCASSPSPASHTHLPLSASQTATATTTTTTTTGGTHSDDRLRPLHTYSPREQQVIQVLCNVIHPLTGKDLIEGEHVTEIKADDAGVVMIRIKLDQHYRQIKHQVENRLEKALGVRRDAPTSSTSPHQQQQPHSQRQDPHKWLSSVRVTLARTQDDPDSLSPVKNPGPSLTQRLSTTSIPSSASGAAAAASSSSPTSISTHTPHTTQQHAPTTGSGTRGLSKVKRVVLVYSGKGGVGKSQVSANLAMALSETYYDGDDGDNGDNGDGKDNHDQTATNNTKNHQSTKHVGSNNHDNNGNDNDNTNTNNKPTEPQQPSPRKLRVGLFDADIYGPSLPSLINVGALSRGLVSVDGITITPSNTSSTTHLVEERVDNDSLIRPILCNGIKLMSYGYVAKTKGSGHGNNTEVTSAPAIMRGVMVSPLLIELLTRTNWGDLDVLVVDMPPGTSDVHITMAQQVKNASAVIVTTPSRLSFVDVVRGMHLLEQTNIPIISLVQNMAYFVAPQDPTRTKHYIFGDSKQFLQQLKVIGGGVPTAVEIPVIPDISNSVEYGIPFLMRHYNHLVAWTNALSRFTSQQLGVFGGNTVAGGAGGISGENNAGNTKPSRAVDSAIDEYHRICHDVMHTNRQTHRQQQQSTIETSTAGSDGTTPTTGTPEQYDELIQETIRTYATLAHHVNHWSHPLRHRALTRHGDHALAYDATSHLVHIKAPAPQQEQQHQHQQPPAQSSLITKATISPYTLRIHCQCAGCVHEQTGKPILDPARVPRDVHPTKLSPRGSYAVAVEWSDGHNSSIYTWNQIDALLKAVADAEAAGKASEGQKQTHNRSDQGMGQHQVDKM